MVSAEATARSLRTSVVTLFFMVLSAKTGFADGGKRPADKSLAAFGAHAGYVAATVPYCGGDATEVEYFAGQVRKMLAKIGGTEGDFVMVRKAMDAAQAKAKPRGRDCTDEGGMDLAAELIRLRDQISTPVKRSGG